MKLTISEEIISEIIKSDAFKQWLKNRRWFGEKNLVNFDLNLQALYFFPNEFLIEIPSIDYTILFCAFSLVADKKKDYFLPLCVLKSLDPLKNKINLDLIQERVLKLDLNNEFSGFSIFEAEFFPYFWTVLFNKYSEFNKSKEINCDLINNELKDFSKIEDVIDIQELGSADTTNRVLKLNLRQSNIVIKSYRKFIPHVEIEAIRTLNKNKFLSVPKILGIISFKSIEVVSIMNYIESESDLGLIYWNDLNDLLDFYRTNLGELIEGNSEKLNHQFEFKFKEFCDNSIQTSDKIGKFLKEMHNCLIDEESYDFKLEKINNDTETYLYTQLKDLLSDIISSINFLKDLEIIKSEEIVESIVGVSSKIDNKDYFLKLKDVKVQRIHQDLHMAQILISKGYADSEYIITDFEGDPQLPLVDQKRKYPVEKDLASFLRSLDYIKIFSLIDAIKAHYWEPSNQIAKKILLALYNNHLHDDIGEQDFKLLKNLMMIGERWQKRISELITVSYYKSEELSNMKKFLINLFTIHRCLMEINYEIRFRPKNVIVPYLGLRGIFLKEIFPD